MKAFGKYISKYLLSFFAFALVLLLINILAFALTFGGIVFREYGSDVYKRQLHDSFFLLPSCGRYNSLFIFPE